MKNQIRRSVFESNSSSMHSVSIIGGDRLTSNLPIGSDGKVHVQYGEFGWGYDSLNTPIRKISYIITDQKSEDVIDMLKDVVKDYTGLELIVEEVDAFYPTGYVDHQSSGTAYEYCQDKETLKDFIFNDKYSIIIDNDNH